MRVMHGVGIDCSLVRISVLLFLLACGLSVQAEAAAAEAVLKFEHDAALQTRLRKALQDKGENYTPRTEHLDAQKQPLYTNRLILEDSPYLIQHAHNPVDWYPWDAEAFAKAKKENKPVFLSIGYSTCHWCHVMERESFENPVIAEVLNKFFVPVKVDRERRPDVDETYMIAINLLTRHGGWPMSSFLTPDGKTFHGGTYYPPQVFAELLEKIHRNWRSNQDELLAFGERVAAEVAKFTETQKATKAFAPAAIADTVNAIMTRYDDLQGGFNAAPKFPNEPLLYLLLNHVERTGDKTVLAALEHTLDEMARGGIYDQVGGGFHRYATDNAWLVPHFEKMLYNQAHLSQIYLRAWSLTNKAELARVVRQTLDFVLRDMTANTGGFYSATDADSDGGEGLYFIWTPEEIRAVLSESDAQLVLNIYGVTKNGNFEGYNILYRAESLAEYAAAHKLDHAALLKRIDTIRQTLLETRNKRTLPLRDDKVITAWNGMMISAFANAGELLKEPKYLDAAIRAGEFIWRQNRNAKGALQRINLRGNVSVPARQEDYAYLAEAYLTLFNVTAKPEWLQRARALTDSMLADFWDKESGGFYMGRADAAVAGMGRAKDSSDGSVPSGNSVALNVLQQLSRRTDNLDYDQYASELLAAFTTKITQDGSGFAYLLSAADDLFKGETGARQFVARGAVAVDAVLDGNALVLDVKMQPGWHVNAREPLQDYLVPTKLQLAEGAKDWQLTGIEYPEAKEMKLGFQQEKLALYEGELRLTGQLKQEGKAPSSGLLPVVQLNVQACNDRICLSPETLNIRPVRR